MKTIVYREREEYKFEHVAVVDGVSLKIENGNLFIRCPDQITTAWGAFDQNLNKKVQTSEIWENIGKCWEYDSTNRSPGVYLRSMESV
tara:strand:- start:12599 stop:12862 length:264 start_codon:yes stop_codon:yes gene_type:complete